MRVLVDAHHLGRRETGNETWTWNMVCALEALDPAEGLEYAVTTAGREELAAITGGPGHLVSDNSALRLAVDLPRLVRARQIDVVVVTYAVPLTTCPSIVVIHDLSLEEAEAAKWVRAGWRRRHRAAIRASSRRAAHILTLSEFTRRQIMERLAVPAARVTVAPAATDRRLHDLLRHTPRVRGGDAFTVLAVGNVVPRKNLLVLAHAIRAGLDAGMNLQLRVVGNVRRTGEAEARAMERILGRAVSFSGYVTPAQLAAAYCSADVLCFPSLFEGFGLPVLEAMTAGIPVVVSDRASLPEVAGDAALVADATDPAAWFTALRLLANDRHLRQALTGRGIERAREFSWRTAADALLHAARAVAGTSRRPDPQARGRAGLRFPGAGEVQTPGAKKSSQTTL